MPAAYLGLRDPLSQQGPEFLRAGVGLHRTVLRRGGVPGAPDRLQALEIRGGGVHGEAGAQEEDLVARGERGVPASHRSGRTSQLLGLCSI